MSRQDFAQPNRPLSTNFTDRTLRRAISEQRRATGSFAEERAFTMKRKNILLRPASMFAALAIAVVGGAGVYAATNWFGGNVQVASDNSVMTVDLSKCQGDTLPPGIGQNTDRTKVQFKITGSPHISEQALEQRLLADCELQTIQKLNESKIGTNSTAVGVIKNKDAGARTLTASVSFGGSTLDKTFALEPGAQIYDKGAAADFSSLQPGEGAVLMYDIQVPVEGTNPFDQAISLKGVFVTQYDLREVTSKNKPLYGEPNNILPLDQYNQLQHKK